MHLENGQSITFTAQNVAQLAANQPNITLTVIFFNYVQKISWLRRGCIQKFSSTTCGKHQKKKQYYQRKQDAEVPGTTTRKSDALDRDTHVHSIPFQR